MNRHRCRCGVGVCVRCICVREGLQCDENCLCFLKICTNRGVEHFQVAEEEEEIVPADMDFNVLKATLPALAANQDQMQDLVAALANRTF
jgi:hypothetical protein